MAVLEASVTSKARENMKKTPKNEKKEVKKVLVVAQELKLARVLAGNNKTARDRALKSLKKWFSSRSASIPFTEDDFLRLWKGLFYSMWMSDKPLIQEECAENISSLVHALPWDSALLFYKCGMTILMNEWFGIDQLRLDKFLMFVRRLLRQALFILKNEDWSANAVDGFTNCLFETILNTGKQKPMGLLMHFVEIFLEELAKVSDGELRPHLMTKFLSPFIKQLAFSDDPRIIDHIKKHVFFYLIRQSDLGLEYDEKYKAWRNLGFPGSIDSMKKVEISDDEELDEEGNEQNGETERPFDPRAGRVDVNLPQMRFHAKAIAKALSEHKFDKNTNSKSRRCLNELSEHFKKLASGIYPLGVKKIKLAKDEYDTSIKKAVNRLVKFDQKIKGKKNKKRKSDDNEIELRGGKKIKLDGDLCQKLEEQLSSKMKKKKRKIEDVPESLPAKQKKKEKLLVVESIFRRNSGTWLVTKTIQQEPENKFDNSTDENGANFEIVDADNEEATQKILYPNKWKSLGSELEIAQEDNDEFEDETEKKSLFPKSAWDDEDTNNGIFDDLKKSRLSLPENLMKNPFANSTPTKRVKINTKLNRAQNVQEHHAQILSSPEIPYDANKKPLKPLLKTPTVKSPVNPFYNF